MGTDRLGMRIAIDRDIKPQTMKKNYRILACMHDHTHARTHARTHAVSEINSSTLNCRRIYVLKRGVRQILKKNEIEKKAKWLSKQCRSR